MSVRSARALWLGWVLLLVGACAHSKIGNTDIDDTEENRSVLAVVDAYERAMESLDADAVIALVHPNFFEDNGNTDSSDDYGYDVFVSSLRESFERTQVMQLNLRVDAVEVEDDSAFAELYYEFRAKTEYPSGVKWSTGADRTRLRMVRAAEEEPWRIVGGI